MSRAYWYLPPASAIPLAMPISARLVHIYSLCDPRCTAIVSSSKHYGICGPREYHTAPCANYHIFPSCLRECYAAQLAHAYVSAPRLSHRALRFIPL